MEIKKLLYDVIIYEIKTGIIESLPGKSMSRYGGFHNAEKRLITVEKRIDNRYAAAIVDADKYKIGDVLRR